MKTQMAAKIVVVLFFVMLIAVGAQTCGDYAVLPAEDHPGVGLLLEAGQERFAQYLPEDLSFGQLVIWLCFAAGAWALYAFCRDACLSRPVSCLGALMVCLCPRFFALAHYSAEMILLAAALFLLWSLLHFAKQPGVVRGSVLVLFVALFAYLATGLVPVDQASSLPRCTGNKDSSGSLCKTSLNPISALKLP